jgi:hypothetical protein
MAAEGSSGRGALRERQAGPGQRCAFAERLEAFAEGGVLEAEDTSQLGLVEALHQQEQRGAQGRRQRRGQGFLVGGTGWELHVVAEGKGEVLPRAAAKGASSEERAVLSRGHSSAAEELVSLKVEPAAQRGDDEVVREVFGLVAHPALLTGQLDERPPHLLKRSHAGRPYQGSGSSAWTHVG